MPRRNTTSSYGSVARFLHWLTALLIATQFPLGLIANSLARTIRSPDAAASEALIGRATLLFSMHKTLGVMIFAVALTRILWALVQPKPGLLNADRRAEAFVAATVYWLLYGSLVLVPLTGWLSHAATTGFAPIWWPFGQSLPGIPKDTNVAAIFGALHRVFGRVLALAIALHVAGALKHALLNRDATLRRMWSGTKAPAPPGAAPSSYPAMLALIVWGAALAIGTATGSFAIDTQRAPTPALPQTASQWQVESGTLGLTVTQLGTPVSGQFDSWRATITFAARPAPGPAGSVRVDIDMTSLRLGAIGDQASGPDYLDSRAFPNARFEGRIERTDTGYVATGPLSLRGVSRDISFPFTLTLADDQATMQAHFSLDRRDFGVGVPISRDQTLGFSVAVTVTLTARRSGAP